jgi:hypothetical protein
MNQLKNIKMSDKKNTSNGLGLGMILFSIFMTLKLTGDIDWSWWWVTSPLWIPVALLFVVFAVIGIAHYIGNKQ